MPEVDVAAALAVVAQGDTPLLLDPAEEKRQRTERPERSDRFDRPDRGGAATAVALARTAAAWSQRRAMAPYRIAVGKRHKVEPRQIVGAIANEGGLGRGDFGNIDIRQDHSIVELPRDLSSESLSKLSRTRISGKLIALEPDDGSTPPRSSGDYPPRATRSRATRSPATDLPGPAGFWSLPAGDLFLVDACAFWAPNLQGAPEAAAVRGVTRATYATRDQGRRLTVEPHRGQWVPWQTSSSWPHRQTEASSRRSSALTVSVEIHPCRSVVIGCSSLPGGAVMSGTGPEAFMTWFGGEICPDGCAAIPGSGSSHPRRVSFGAADAQRCCSGTVRH